MWLTSSFQILVDRVCSDKNKTKCTQFQLGLSRDVIGDEEISEYCSLKIAEITRYGLITISKRRSKLWLLRGHPIRKLCCAIWLPLRTYLCRVRTLARWGKIIVENGEWKRTRSQCYLALISKVSNTTLLPFHFLQLQFQPRAHLPGSKRVCKGVHLPHSTCITVPP